MTKQASGRYPLAAVAATLAALGVGLGAYGAHGLRVDESLIRIWETAVAYQMWHSLGAIAASWLADRRGGPGGRIALLGGWSMLIGSVLFSGSLYFFVMTGIVPMAGAAPLGGVAMIAGWLMLAGIALTRSRLPNGVF